MRNFYFKFIKFVISSFSLLLIILFLSGSVIAVNYRITCEIGTSVNNISGPGSADRISEEGFTYKGRYNLFMNTEQGDFFYQFNLGVNNDTQMYKDKQIFAINRLRFSLQNDPITVNIGDTFEFFSQYALSSSIKGLSVRYNNDDSELTFVLGYNYPRWENLLNSSSYPAVERVITGTGYELTRTMDSTIGFSVTNTKDRKGINSNDTLYNNTVYDFKWRVMPIEGLNVEGISAYARTEETTPDDKYSGMAHKVTVSSSGPPGRALLEYERVSPGFVSLMGSSTADRERFNAKLLYRYSREITFNFEYLYFHDNLDGQKEYRTYNQRPEVGINIRSPFERRYASTSFKYNINWRNMGNRKMIDNRFILSYRDRFSWLEMDAGIDYTKTIVDELEQRSNDENKVNYNITLSTRQTLDGYILRPTIRLGYFTLTDKLDLTGSNTFESSLGLQMDIPAQRINSNLRLGQRNYIDDDNGDNRRAFVQLNVNYNPIFLEKYNRGRIYIRIAYNRLKHLYESDRNLSENSITTGMNFGF